MTEIDIMEHVGFDPGAIHASVHTRAYNHVDRTQRTARTAIANAQDEFHVYAIEWTPDGIRALADGQAYFTFAVERASNAQADGGSGPSIAISASS